MAKKQTVDKHHRTWMAPEDYDVYREVQAKQVPPSEHVVHPSSVAPRPKAQLDGWPEQWWRTVSYKWIRCRQCGSWIPPQQTFVTSMTDERSPLCRCCAEAAMVWDEASDSRRLKATAAPRRANADHP